MSSYYRSKPDTVKRIRPFNLFANGTALSSVIELYKSDIVTWTTFVGPGTFHSYSSSIHPHRPQGVVAHPIISDSEIADMKNIVRNKVLEKARNRGVNLANMLGEYRQAASLFGDLTKKFVTATLAVVHRDPRILIYGHYYPSGRLRPGGSLRESKRFFNEYLAYTYGIKPLMQDIEQAVVDIKSASAARVPSDLIVEYTSRRANVSQSGVSGLDPGQRWTESRSYHTGVKAFARISYRNDLLNSTLGRYGMTNPLSLAWELTAFSFVYDWWFNIGEFLGSLDNSLYFDGSGSKIIYTTKRRIDSKVSILSGTASYSNDARNRTVPTMLGTIAQLRYKPSTSSTHIANGLALIGSKLTNIASRSRRTK